MLQWRLLLGTLFVAVLIGSAWGDVLLANDGRPAGLLLAPLAILVATGATHEYLAMVRTREPQIAGRVLFVGNVAVTASPWFAILIGRDPANAQLVAFAAALISLALVEIFRYDKDSSARIVERLGLSVLGLTYVGLLMSFVVRLRLSSFGMLPLASMLVVVKLGDIGAYTVGRVVGLRKLAPKLSPGKTVEGLAGGLMFSLVGMFVLARICPPPFSSSHNEDAVSRFIVMTVVYAIAVSLTGVAGDLLESLLKRDFGRKDSSDWMPGFGGVLDLVDSPLLAAPVAWAFWEFGWLLGLP